MIVDWLVKPNAAALGENQVFRSVFSDNGNGLAMGNAKRYALDSRGAVGVNVMQIPGLNNMMAHLKHCISNIICIRRPLMTVF